MTFEVGGITCNSRLNLKFTLSFILFFSSLNLLPALETQEAAGPTKRHAVGEFELQDDVEEFDEEALYLLNSPVVINLPLVERSVEGKLNKYSRIRVFDEGTVADLCNPDLCTPRLQKLVSAKKGGRTCLELGL